MKDNSRKTQIIKAAQKRFTRHGLNKTTIEEIARDLRMGKASLYHYFKSKEEIFYEVSKLEVERFKNELKTLIDEESYDLTQKQFAYLKLKESINEKYPILFELISQIVNDHAFEKEILFFNKLISDESKWIQPLFNEGSIKSQDIQLKLLFVARISWLFPFLVKISQANPGKQTIGDTIYPLNLFV